jgi:hypothetical protein
LLVAVLLTCVSALVTVTCTPGMTALLGSVMVPVILPVASWAEDSMGNEKRTAASTAAFESFMRNTPRFKSK